MSATVASTPYKVAISSALGPGEPRGTRIKPLKTPVPSLSTAYQSSTIWSSYRSAYCLPITTNDPSFSHQVLRCSWWELGHQSTANRTGTDVAVLFVTTPGQYAQMRRSDVTDFANTSCSLRRSSILVAVRTPALWSTSLDIIRI
jgi:hypothetical protein